MKFYVLFFGVLMILLNAAGLAYAGDQEINVYDPSGNPLTSNSGYVDLGTEIVYRPGATSMIFCFVIENSGQDPLWLDGVPDPVYVSGLDAAMFHVDCSSTSVTLGGGSYTMFTITFVPTSLGLKHTTIYIPSDDHNGGEDPFLINLEATGVDCEINVKQGNNDIACTTGVYDFGNVEVNTCSNNIAFIIENVGTSPLNLTGIPMISIVGGTPAGVFGGSWTTVLTLNPGQHCDFVLNFSPSAKGYDSATVSIPNTDANENPYTFTISGTGIHCEINVRVGTQNIPSGGSFNFGNTVPNSSSQTVTFTIENLESIPLDVSTSYTIGGSDPGMFTIDMTSVVTPVSYGTPTTFTVVFTPTSTGIKSAFFEIPNSDLNEDPYIITVNATCFETKFDFNDDGYSDTIVSATNKDAGANISGCVYIFYGSQSPASTIDASLADVKIYGNVQATRTEFGFSTCKAGDFNNDGVDDLIIGESYYNSGYAYIFFGSLNPTAAMTYQDADVTLSGNSSGDQFGYSVSYAGDVNADGYDDVIVGAPYDDDGGTDSGCAFLFYGSASPSSTISASSADVIFTGEDDGDYFGCSVSDAGNVDGDDYDDVVIGAYMAGTYTTGKVYLQMGSSSLSSTYDASAVTVEITGQNSNDHFGISVSGIGDFNRDGAEVYDDIIIGADYATGNAANSGCAYIYFGVTGWNGDFDYSNADVWLKGVSTGDKFGCAVSEAGNVDEDAYDCDDVIVGATGVDTNGADSGCAYIFFGSPAVTTPITASDSIVAAINGDNAGDSLGFSVGSVGNINHDGRDEIIVGAIQDDDGGSASGCAFIFYGRSNYNWTNYSPFNASDYTIKLVGEDADDWFGKNVGCSN